MKVNRRLLPVKAHWFFFMAASGPILPFLTVYGKQLGISEIVMGSITAILPFAFLIAKPFFGYLLDYFHKQRKLLFITLIVSMSFFYVLLYFVPHQNVNVSWSNSTENGTATSGSIYNSLAFYSFVTLMCLSMLAYNVANSVSDAVCFDVLGEGNETEYGKQRVWGAIGFGITALMGGVFMDLWSEDGVKNYTPAFVLVLIFTTIDVVFCTRLDLPKMRHSRQILKDVRWVLQKKRVVIFLGFTLLAGILESFIIYFMFWFLEDLSASQNTMRSIKILEGLIVAAETLGGELLFFPLSGKILTKFGHGNTFTLCFFAYGLRLGLISVIPSQWWLLPVELFMQGPSFALCYTAVVAYASAVSPPGTSATMQGLVAGVDDGFGFALGSLIGGFLYKAVGGRLAFQIFSAIAFVCCISHGLLYRFYLSRKENEATDEPPSGFGYKDPIEALKIVNDVSVDS